MLSQQDKVMAITDTTAAQSLFDEGFPARRYGSAKAAINAAYRFISNRVAKQFTYRRARSLKEGTARRVDSEEMDALRLAVLEENRREQQELRSRLAALDKILANAVEASPRSSLAGQGGEVCG